MRIGQSGPVAGRASTKIGNNKAKAVAEFAHNEGIFYFSCRGDYWWRALHTCKDSEILDALARTDVALAFPHCSVEIRKCEKLNTKLAEESGLECDACYCVPPGEAVLTFNPDSESDNNFLTRINECLLTSSGVDSKNDRKGKKSSSASFGLFTRNWENLRKKAPIGT
jgi:hypothetical protein